MLSWENGLDSWLAYWNKSHQREKQRDATMKGSRLWTRQQNLTIKIRTNSDVSVDSV